jgi:hypothetical protein
LGIPLSKQLSALLLSLACGGLCGALYDLFRISRVLLGFSEYTSAARKLYAAPLPLIGSVCRPGKTSVRNRIEHALIALGDVLYGILSGCVFSVFLYVAASGCFRWFYLAGAGIGFLIYYFTIGRIVVLSSDVIVYVLRLVAAYVRYFLCLPVRAVLWTAGWMGRVVYRRILLPLRHRSHIRRCRSYTESMRCRLYADVRLTEEGVDDFAKMEK